MLKIPNKRRFYELAMQGRFGNVPHMWWSYEDFMADGAPFERLNIRCLTPGDPRFRAFISCADIPATLDELHFRSGTYILTEPLCRGSRLQGELSYIAGQLVFYYTHNAMPMRRALMHHGRHAHGRKALEILRSHLAPADVDDLLQILDDGVGGGAVETCIEFSVPTIPFGIFPRRSIVIWEVRQY